VVIDADSAVFDPTAVADRTVDGGARLRPRSNPFRGSLELSLELDRPGSVALEVFDLAGRRVARVEHVRLERGLNQLAWDGRRSDGGDAGAGAFWVRAVLGERVLGCRVVRLR
jgi:hypothetical protein